MYDGWWLKGVLFMRVGFNTDKSNSQPIKAYSQPIKPKTPTFAGSDGEKKKDLKVLDRDCFERACEIIAKKNENIEYQKGENTRMKALLIENGVDPKNAKASVVDYVA